MNASRDRYITGSDISDAWLTAVEVLNGTPGHKAVHFLVRVLDPATEEATIRKHAQGLIDKWNQANPQREMPHIDTTRNTIFPAAFARRLGGPEELAVYYRQRLTKDGLLGFRNNERGTYFGRVVAYPRADGSIGDQLTETVRKLRQELAVHGPKSSRYEINIHNERLDRSPMSFPCLAHMSFHLHEQRLHLQAIYRNESLVSRAYGNFLGLSQLQCYVARSVGIEPGELLITAGHIELDGRKQDVREMLSSIRSR
ncbi:MAG: thymidylate synthase [Candidatus Dormibacteraceae bacterium]